MIQFADAHQRLPVAYDQAAWLDPDGLLPFHRLEFLVDALHMGAQRRMSCLSEGDSEENQRPLWMASRSSIVRMGSSMLCTAALESRRRMRPETLGARISDFHIKQAPLGQ